MRIHHLLIALPMSLCLGGIVHAQTAPAGATGQCRDGSYTNATSKSGACRGHKGVQNWYAAAPSAAATPAAPVRPAAGMPAAVRPADATGLCRDGTYTNAASKAGACRGHKGVQDWYAAQSAAPAPASASTVPPAAQSAGPRPANATGMCRDGTYATSSIKLGACVGHKGIHEWYGKAAPASAPATPAAAPAPAPAAAPVPTATAPAARPAAAPVAAPARAGQVWANRTTKVYHCPGDRWYGNTKAGEYMTEAAAVAEGIRPSRGKACTQ